MGSVGDALLEQLAGHGVEVCFGVPGVHNLAFWVGAGVGGRPRVVGVRHEQTAGYAADTVHARAEVSASHSPPQDPASRTPSPRSARPTPASPPSS